MHIDSATDSLSYWHATQEPFIPDDPLPATADVVVIGGGMLGCWTTYWLAKSGASVVLLEKNAIGWGASGRNGGFLIEGAAVGYERLIELLGLDAARDFYALTMHGQQLAHDIVENEGIDCDLRRTGTLSLALSRDELSAMSTQHQLLGADGFHTELLDRAAMQDYIRTPLAEEIVGGYLAPTGGTLHSSRYIAGLARAAQRHGASIVNADVTSVVTAGNSTTVHSYLGPIDAGKVVVALNAWTDTLIPEMDGVIVPTRGQILSYKPTRQVFTTATGAEITTTGEYWQQRPDGSIVIGGCREDAPQKDSGVRDMVATPDVITKIGQVLPRLFPELHDLDIDRQWAGLMAFTRDGLPIVDHSEFSDNVWYGGGFNGHGMPFGPIIGQLLTTTVLNGQRAPELAPLVHTRSSLG